ncbi:MAG: glycosyl transferase [Bacteroidetes bacterium]|nr:glycosyl transferase [Bacteroidota bacterium]
MQNFCTLFDSFFLNRALVMYESLKKHCPNFHLYIFPFDEVALQILQKLNLENVTLIPLLEFENKDLLRIKSSRSKGEYCWTCTPYIIDCAIENFNLSQCTYIDADLCFYSDPQELLDEMGDTSVLITEHRYSKQYDVSKTHGIYCVQFLSIKNNVDGLRALHWWRDKCLEWCYNRLEAGKFGDQKYLDDWTSRFKGVHVLQHIGGGVAPWNVQQYELTKDQSDIWWATEKTTSKKEKLVFYHFHYVRFLKKNKVDISDYQISHSAVFSLYADYLVRIKQVNATLSEFDLITSPQPFRTKRTWLTPLDKLKREWKGVYNVFEQKSFIEKWLT